MFPSLGLKWREGVTAGAAAALLPPQGNVCLSMEPTWNKKAQRWERKQVIHA